MSKITWKNDKRKVADLKTFRGNPRHFGEKQTQDLTKSLEKFDVATPLVINTDNTVIGGNFRLKILKDKGIKEVAVRVPNRKLTKKEAGELNVRLNKNQGEWDKDLLAQFSEDMLGEIGFDNDELDEIFGMEMADDFDVNKETDKVLKGDKCRTKDGQLWKLGNHRLIVGDSTDRKVWERLFGKERFDFMFTDPPYRLAYSKKRTRKVKTKEGFKSKRQRTYDKTGETNRKGKPTQMEPRYLKIKKWAVEKRTQKSTPQYRALESLGKKGKPQFAFGSKLNREYEGVKMNQGVPEFDEWLGIAKDFQNSEGANVMIFENWKNTRELWNAVEEYWKVMNMIIWHTPNRMQGFTAHHRFYNKYDIAILGGEVPINEENEEEMIEYMTEEGEKVLNTFGVIIYGTSETKPDRRKQTKQAKKIKWGRVTDHVVHNVGSESDTGQNLVFGTKPIPILIPYIKVLSPRRGIIADPYGGSGSAIVASEIMKRKCYMIELSSLYAEVILRRWEKFTGKKAELVE